MFYAEVSHLPLWNCALFVDLGGLCCGECRVAMELAVCVRLVVYFYTL